MDRSLSEGMEYSGDPAVGSFFSTDYKRNDDLKQMLDSNRDNLKLEAMKRIIGMIAKGRDASDLFPAVVKNVVSKNTEVKKLVYVYLVRYAEEQQDLALLSISTFQRALKDPNQLIRASALRVLSSIRVTVIVPIVMLAIRDSAADMSPYVRKTAAHAIPKLYSLDPEQKDELVQILDKLLADRTTLVVGSAVMAFEEVCPERIDLIHKNYRKLCSLLVDVDEWGQVVIVNTLTRYGRTQFLDPNIGDITIDGEEKPFYEEEDKDEHGDGHDDRDDQETSSAANRKKPNNSETAKNKPQMDPDHRLLLKNCRPLLQSRSASVVMSVVQLYHHLAPRTEVHAVIKPLIRLLRFHPEVQAVVLTCIAAMSTNRKTLFEPYMKSFFVRSSDPTQIKLFKLEILTNIATETNISSILREFQTYISSQDKEFVTATIEAIGRCASSIKEVAETCLNGLVSLLSHRDPSVVGGAVVVAKTLLQSQRSGNKAVIAQLAKMVDRVSVAPARAAILWLLGEHCERIPHLPPDVLRKMAKTFADEEDIVKLQIINLAAKLQLTNPGQTTLLCQYILNLAKYDQSYDIRDRARFLRHLLFPDNPESKLHKYAKKIILSSKPAPVLQSKFKDRDHFQLGSLSHFLNTRAFGYQDLPHFPTEAPDPTVRNVEPSPSYSPETRTSKLDSKSTKNRKQSTKKASFYSDSDKSNKSDSGDESGSGTADSESDSDGSEDGSSSSSASEASSAEPGSSAEESKAKPKIKSKTKGSERKVVRYNEASKTRGSESGTATGSSTSNSSSSEPNSSSASSESEDSSEHEKKKSSKKVGKQAVAAKGKIPTRVEKLKESSNVALLLDLGFDEAENAGNGEGATNPSASHLQMHSLGSLLSPTSASNGTKIDSNPVPSMGFVQGASPVFIPQKRSELLNKITSGGLQITYRFTRAPHLISTSMTTIELEFHNLSKDSFKNIQIGQKTLPAGISVHDFPSIGVLEVGRSTLATLGIDFNDTTQGAKMEILWATEVEPKKQTVTIKAPIGELIRPVTMSESLFIAEQGKLRGMTEHEAKTFVNSTFRTGSTGLTSLVRKVYETGNLLQVPSTKDDLVRFAGQLSSSKTLVLVSIHLGKSDGEGETESRIVVNCEKMVIGSLLVQELKGALN